MKKRNHKIRNEVVNKITALITAAFGLVAALAWNETIQTIFRRVYGTYESIPAQLIYAITVTIIAVIAAMYMGRIAGRAK